MEDEEDYVNLEGVFRPRPNEHEHGVMLDTKSPNWAELSKVITKGPVEHSKYVLKGAWYCPNQYCHSFMSMRQGEYVSIWNDATNQAHYEKVENCINCDAHCGFAPVVLFVQYLSQRGYDDLRIRLQRQAAREKPRDRGVAKVHVLANTGKRQPVSTSPYPGRLLGPDHELLDWFHSGEQVSEEQDSGDS